MTFEEQLAAYGQQVAAWKQACAKAVAAVKKLEVAAAIGNVREIEKLRQNAEKAIGSAQEFANAIPAWEFDAELYLREGQFLDDLRMAAKVAGLRLYEGDGILHCPPVLIRTEPGNQAVRVEKKLMAGIRPTALAKVLKQLQDKGAKPTDSRKFIEVLFAGYQAVRGFARLSNKRLQQSDYEAVALRQVYKSLTILPDSARDYSLADFLRSVYHLTKSDVTETKDGFRVDIREANTAGKEKPLLYVADDGSELRFAFVQFTPPRTG